MDRVLSKDVILHKDKKIKVSGWLHKKRLLGGLNFISIRDRTGVLQMLVENKNELEKLRGLQTGTVFNATGLVVADKRAPGGAELHDVEIEILVPVNDESPIEIDKPISHKPENHDTLFEYRAINLRNLTEQKIFKIRASLLKHIREYLNNHDFTEIQTPKLLAGATEGGAEVFKLDYFGKEATLAQSPQFYKQMMVGVFERVYEIGQAYRAELSATTRHLTELTMLDVEMGFIKNHDEVMDVVGDMTIYVLNMIAKEHSADLKSLQAPELHLPKDNKIPRFSVAEIHEMYTKATKVNTTEEKDLTPEEERWICEYAKKKLGSDLVYATHFPIENMKFYHMVAEDGKTVLWADLLFRGLEIATVPVREHRYNKLIAQMEKAGINVKDEGYKYYLEAFKYGLPAHGGCGYGIDRLVEKTIGLKNVKEATLFPRDINRLAP